MKKSIKYTSVILAVLMTAGCIPTAFAAEENNSAKEEVIYVNADANANVDEVNVVNIYGKGDITDYGKYTDVKLLNAVGKVSNNGDSVSFKSDLDKIYFQGTLENAELPWNISITYYLDGKEITPENLAGKSGKLKIKFKITQNKKCKENFYADYALQAAFSLDTKQCSNIKADKATIANVGSSKQLSYTILPDKGIDTEITADIKDFEMDAVSINAVKLNLDIQVDDSELTEMIDEISDASNKLNSGAKSVDSGANKLKSGSSELSSGSQSLNSGAKQLDSGISSLSSGAVALQSGLDTLTQKSSDLNNGSSEFLSALKEVNSALSNVSMSTEDLKKLTDSSSAIKSGITDLYNGALNLQANLGYEQYKAAVRNASGGVLDVDSVLLGNQTAISSLQSQIETLNNSLSQITSVSGWESDPQLAAQASQIQAQIESLSNVINLLSGNSAVIGGTETYLNSLQSGTAELVSGLETLKTNYEKFDSEISALADKLSDLSVNMTKLQSAVQSLVTAYEQLDSGTSEYTSGVATVASNYDKIVSGTKEISSGSKSLVSGTESLKSGSSTLYNGISLLCDGTAELSDGTKEFYEQASDTHSTADEKIDEILASIKGGDGDPYSFVSSKNTNVSSVQFVIKTDAIEKPEEKKVEEKETKETSFWDKLVNLFTGFFG